MHGGFEPSQLLDEVNTPPPPHFCSTFRIVYSSFIKIFASLWSTYWSNHTVLGGPSV